MRGNHQSLKEKSNDSKYRELVCLTGLELDVVLGFMLHRFFLIQEQKRWSVDPGLCSLSGWNSGKISLVLKV